MADKNTQAVAKRETIDIVTARIKEFQNKGELKFPENYVPENALKSAWLMIQETVDKNDKPALEVCTQASVANALLGMVVQGLNPDKKQCYFIVRGKKLYAQRSYFGSIHVAKMVDPSIVDVYPQTIYQDDEFEYEIKHGKAIITTHKQKFGNILKDKIAGAYATILYTDGRELSTIMTLDQIKQAWKQSPMHPVDEKGNVKAGSTHDKFTADMCEKTVANKACKYVINTSDDKSIVAKYAKMMDAEFTEAEVEAEIDENANKQMIDITEASYTISEAEEEVSTEDKAEGATENAPVQEQKSKKQQREQKNLMDMAEEGPGY
jgi:recombination protein RecT